MRSLQLERLRKKASQSWHILDIELPTPHDKQQLIIDSKAKRKCIRAGRRAGKTIVAAIIAVTAFRAGKRILYATPTTEQLDRFWATVKTALQEPIDNGYYYKNEGRHIIELQGTEQRIRAKTAHDADTLRGDYADILIFDEYQMIKPDAWQKVGAPMLLDNNGDAIFIYTTRAGKKGDHARKLYNHADQDKTGRWEAFTFSSHENPYLSEDALDDIVTDMTAMDYKMEIMAIEIDDDPDALWTRETIEETRATSHPLLTRIVVGVDPPGSVGTECGIVVAGSALVGKELHAYVLDDRSLKGKPRQWGEAVVSAYRIHKADRVLGEVNYGGDMVENTITTVAELDTENGTYIAYKEMRATRGKAVRAEPVSSLYEKGRVHHIGEYEKLEDEQTNWVPNSGMPSPNRLDALVWCITELLVGKQGARSEDMMDLGEVEGFVSKWA